MKEKWLQFQEKHPKAAKWLYQIFYFWVFSMGVTILQYLMFTFFPYLFGTGLAGVEFMWPQIPIHFAGFDYKWNILGYEVARNAVGEMVIGGGLGYFISYELGTFLAQCVNFPLQRNITFKSHGKYRVADPLVFYCMGDDLPCVQCCKRSVDADRAELFRACRLQYTCYIYYTGGVSMVIYFFVYKIIFPEGEAKKN